MTPTDESDTKKEQAPEPEAKAKCGLVMPISAIDGCSAEHWIEVRAIITEAIENIPAPQFSVNLVSDADDVGVIQKRIVQNIYTSDVVVCDVSGKNPNVMFELGLRLAFDKATVIVKDDMTDYSFDTGVIEHLTYPRDLRFARIVDFKKQLAAKVSGTYQAAQEDPHHSPFIKNFGQFQVAKLQQAEVSPDKVVLEMLSDLQSEVFSLKRMVGRPSVRAVAPGYASGLVQIAACLSKYQHMRAADDVGPLKMDGELMAWIEREIDAPKYFDTARDFWRAVESVLKELNIK